MKYISTPLEFNEEGTQILREIDDRIKVLDNLVELIVFTPRGSFEADPDFGFEYWNHEYSNVHYREFNNSQTGRGARGIQNEVLQTSNCGAETQIPNMKLTSLWRETLMMD